MNKELEAKSAATFVKLHQTKDIKLCELCGFVDMCVVCRNAVIFNYEGGVPLLFGVDTSSPTHSLFSSLEIICYLYAKRLF